MSFIEKQIDYFMLMQLKDLASSFMKKDVDILYNQVSFLDIHTPKITISSFWEHRTSMTHLGEKSDVYLRALGNYHDSDRKSIIRFLAKNNNKNSLPSFTKQLLSFLEDLRLEKKIISIRPGTRKAFQYRKIHYLKFFRDQLNVNQSRGFPADILFCFICLIALDNKSFYSESILTFTEETIIKIKEKVLSIYEKNSTEDCVQIAWNITELVQTHIHRDMINMYFTIPKIENIKDMENVEDESFDETLPTWSRERKKQKEETFLQFDEVNGEHSDNKVTTPRQSESTDQVMAIVQGNSQQSDLNDHSEADSSLQESDEQEGFHKGKENRYAIALDKEILPITDEDQLKYLKFVDETSLEKRRLVKLLKDILERKHENNIRRLHFGRLDKNLIPFFIDEHPKLFIKKDKDNIFDSTFSLLVDCSSSMMNKMDQTKKSIVLFHETLKELKIPHSISGFYEDGMESDEHYQPNYFQEVVSFKSSLQKQVGPSIMQLKPEEDNRDGFAIRFIANKLKKQSAKNKYVLILTDGKPAAFNYFQNGVMDTKEAIQDVRKLGIETIGIQIGSLDEEHDLMMESIYNNNYLIINSLEEMPSQFAFLLKKLLLKK